MCGISVIAGNGWQKNQLQAMVKSQHHRGPDDQGIYINENQSIGLGHNRLGIIDLSSVGHQPMSNRDGSLWIILNGEIYNYTELRSELTDYPYKSKSDTEVILAAYERWGTDCLKHFIGVFAFALWDERLKKLFAARDRFGVKPLYCHQNQKGFLMLASEIKAFHAAGIARSFNEKMWATYFRFGLYDHAVETFWDGINQVPPGEMMEWNEDQGLRKTIWYDVAEAVQKTGFDEREDDVAAEELISLLKESVAFNLRSDVPVGICLSGGLDSSLLLRLAHQSQGKDLSMDVFTFYFNDTRYDEIPWVTSVVEKTHQWHRCLLEPGSVPGLANKIQFYQDEPFGGIPTLAMSHLFERAHEKNIKVLLNGNGLDEGWGGYDYYQNINPIDFSRGTLQGSKSKSANIECLNLDFMDIAEPFIFLKPFEDDLRNIQYRDIRYSKIPRTMRFNDRISMMHSCEVREPFLDHRIIELGLRQPSRRKIQGGQGKWLLRYIAKRMLPQKICDATKRPVQTPQREWLSAPLAKWANQLIEEGLNSQGKKWFDRDRVIRFWSQYQKNESDNSFPFWQWINLGLMSRCS